MKASLIPVFVFYSLIAHGQTVKVGENPQQMVFSANGRVLAVSCQDGNYVYDITKGQTYRCPAGRLSDISRNGSKIAIVDEKKGRLTIWAVTHHRTLRTWQGKPAIYGGPIEPDDATFSPDGNEVMFTPNPGDEKAIMPLVRMNIKTGKISEFGKWSCPLAVPIAKTLSAEGPFSKTVPK